MSRERTQVEIIEGVINQVDDLYWLIKCMQNSGFDEMAADQIYASFNCILKLLRAIRDDAIKLDKPVV